MSERGAVLFARYAYPPNALGYCGPDGAGAMLRPGAAAEIERRARQFEGAWSYLELIAECSDIADPLDERVVEAYWVGNDLLDLVEPDDLVARLSDRFRGQLGGTWREASDRARAHHSFQVFEVYPWAGLLGSAGTPTAVNVLDRCRIRAGRVIEVAGEQAVVESRPLSWDGGALAVSSAHQERVGWSVDGLSLVDGLSAGDRVALHWDWVCDVLTEDQVLRIEAAELCQRTSVGLSPVGR
jgi:Family of unknown function (DUF6390)